jgi:hypothetical protein
MIWSRHSRRIEPIGRLKLFWRFLDFVRIGIFSVVPNGGGSEMRSLLETGPRGFVMALVLTAIPFGLVMLKALPETRWWQLWLSWRRRK